MKIEITGFWYLYTDTDTHTTEGSTYSAFQLVWYPYLSLSFFLFQMLIQSGILWEEEIHGKYCKLQFLLQFQCNFTQRTHFLRSSCPLEILSLNSSIIMLHLELQLKYNLSWRTVLVRNGH